MAVVGAVLVTAGMLPFRDVLAGGAVGLAFMVPVVVATAVGGVPGAIAGVISGFLAFNVLFTEPYRTVKVSDVNDVIGLVAFVLVGAISSVTVVLQHRAEAEARRRAGEARTLFELSGSLISPGSLDAVLQTVVGQVRELFALRTAAVLLPDEEGRLGLAALAGERLPVEVQQALSGSGKLRDAGDGPVAAEVSGSWRASRLHVDDDPVGVFVTGGVVDPAELRVFRTFTNQAALAVQRAQLAEQATRAQVLEEVDRLRTAVIRSVSHDLRTPLASIRAAAEDLGDERLPLSASDRAVLAGTIVEEAERLDRLVANLLDMSRVEAGELSPRLEVVALGDVVREVVDRHRPETVDVEVPPGGAPALVDPVMIEQVLDNLVDNALRHGGGGRPPVVEVERRGGEMVVRVVDHGPGIPKPKRARVFETFYRGEVPVEGTAGTGVGLAICQGFVEAHDGEIWVDETPGGGATVGFTVAASEPPPGGGRAGDDREQSS